MEGNNSSHTHRCGSSLTRRGQRWYMVIGTGKQALREMEKKRCEKRTQKKKKRRK